MAVQWPLLIFSVLLGISSGILVFLGIGEIRGMFKKVRFPLALVALVLLAVGGCASAMHLGHIDRALYILGNPASGLSKELFAVGFTAVVTLVYLILSRKDYPGPAKVFGILALVGGIVLPLVAGASYIMPARPAWDSVTLPLMYLGTGLGMGFTLSAAVVCAKGDQGERAFGLKLALAGVIISVVVMAAYIAWIAMAPHQDSSRSIDLLLSGNLAMAFWLGVVVLGMALPLVLVAVAQRGAKPNAGAGGASGALWGAFASLVIGNVALRVIMYLVATSVEQLIYIF